MYQALYRKYRPTCFDEIVGQDVIIKTFKNAIKNKKLSHAYLFSGPRGTGKTSTAKILAKTINCENLHEFEPCNQCNSCIQINNKQNTDIIEIDAASNNGVDEIRELKSKVNLVPANSKYKVYIIDEVHMLSTGAFNALLKTLEEPPSHIIFILATTEIHKIPATILSRCQKFDFKKISPKKIVENLKKIVTKENLNIEEDALKEIAILSQGAMRDAIGLLDQAISYSPENITIQDIHDINGTLETTILQQVIGYIINNDMLNLLKIFDEFDENGKNLIKICEELIYYLRNIVIFQISPDYFVEEEKQNFKKLGTIIDKKILLSYIQQFSNAIYEMKNSDNEKITLELNLIKMMELEKNIESSVGYDQNVESEIKDLNIEEENAKIKKKISVKNTQIQKIVENKPQKNTSYIEESQLEILKTTRINNTLATFNKKIFLEYKENLKKITNYFVDEECSQWGALILDGELKAVGRQHMIFVYKDEPREYLFNHNLKQIEFLIEKIYSEKIKVIATNIEAWNIIKQEFNSKSKVYTWQEEKSEIKKEVRAIKKNKIETLFEDIIEYSE